MGGDPVQHLGSGQVVGGFEFPRIDITISVNGIWCFDTVIHVNAVPACDVDGDGDADLDDATHWPGCMTGPNGGPYQAMCEPFDIELDGDVDLQDFAGLQRAIAGS